jgi:2-methylisocitrate lyase-like PEP mutase family enzyme
MSRLGMADIGVATMNDMRDNATMIASIDPSVPLIADADTGYGGKLRQYLWTRRVGREDSTYDNQALSSSVALCSPISVVV